MPKTPVHKDDGTVAHHNNIRFTRQIPPVETEPVSHAVQQAPDKLLRNSVAPLNTGHVPTAALGCQGIGHVGSWITGDCGHKKAAPSAQATKEL